LVAPIAAAGDLSSPKALQLFGLLYCFLKACSSDARSQLSDLPEESLEQQASSDASTALLVAVSTMVGTALSNHSTATLHGGSSSSSDGSTACTAVLPWLVLLGRCCHACAALMQHCQHTLQSDAAAVSFQAHDWALHQRVLTNHLHELQSSLADVVQWLAADSTMQQPTALGYEPQDLQQQLAAAADALPALSNDMQAADPFTDGHAAAVEALQAAQQQLQAAGRVLACFAIPHACNNPACENLSGPSEAQLFGGRSCICAGCRTARYCGKACQRAAWCQHKPVCKTLAAAAAAAAGPQPSSSEAEHIR
jgi:hypothetical protein